MAEIKKGMKISELKKLLRYDPETGVFTNRINRAARARKGEVVGCARDDGYLRVNINGKTYYLHRLAWAFVHGRWPKEKIDHEDRDPGNNRILNLREAGPIDNTCNQKRRKDNASGCAGVHWHKLAGKWQAGVKYAGTFYYLGLFSEYDDAASAASKKRAELHGKFCNANK